MKDYFNRFIIALFLGATVLLLFRYARGYDDSIDYFVTTSAEPTEFAAYPFTKGLFQFSFKGEVYSLAESFAAGPIIRDLTAETGFLLLITIGLCLMLAILTALPRTFFIGAMALFIFFLISLNLSEVSLFGFAGESSAAIIILLAAFLLPAYLFHAFFPEVGTSVRFLVFVVITSLIVLFGGVSHEVFVDQFTVGSHFGLAVIGLIFLFLIAEENVFAILFLITKTKGGKNNHLHFIVFSLIYLGILGLYYGKKSGVIQTEVAFFDPFILLAVSGLITLWTIQYKADIFKNLLTISEARSLVAALGIITLGFLSLAMYRGNDPVYESFHYLIIYSHLAFGAFFFIYILTNFLTPLIQGLTVCQVAFKSQNFPYASARLAGMVAVAAFFFLASKEVFLLIRAGHYNYLGAQAEQVDENLLAGEYYRQGMVFGHNNHYSNYKVGYRELQKGNTKEANFRFSRAALRYPSPQSFVNKSSTYALMAEATPSMVALKEGLREFPSNPQLQNNLGLTYADLGKTKEAIDLLSESGLNDQWTNANLVNLWKLKQSAENAEQDFENGNVAVKANVIQALLKTQQEANIVFDTAYLYPSYGLHRLAFLINASWYFPNKRIPIEMQKALNVPLNEDIYWHAKNAAALAFYGAGNINDALRTFDQLATDSRREQKARMYNQMGLIALSQHSIQEALRFFEQAISEGSEAAFLKKQACLLETGDLDKAIKWSEYLVSIDSSYSQLKTDLEALQSKEVLSADLQKMRMYYFYKDYSTAEISSGLSEADEAFRVSLWAKMAKESLTEKNFEAYQNYRSVFSNLLETAYFSETDMVIRLFKGQSPVNSDHPVGKLISSADSNRYQELTNLINNNAYNEPLILSVVSYLENEDLSTAYQLLVEAVDINKSSIEMRKQYVLIAIKSGLTRYAEDMLTQLKTKMPTSDFSSFETRAEELKTTMAENAW